MSYKNIVISSGHGSIVRGASSILDEVDEARKVVEAVAERLRARGADVVTFHDDTSKDQSTNLHTIVDFHNAQSRQLDISVHFNCFEYCVPGRGVECLYKSQTTLAAQMSSAMAEAGELINRGAKLRHDLFFLNETSGPAILLECAFCDSEEDARLYDEHFDAICESIAGVLKHKEGEELPPSESPLLIVKGKVSHFGGPEDVDGVGAAEGLAFIQDVMDAPHLFLPYQPEGTTGLARRLNSKCVAYCAARWDYNVTPPEMLLTKKALVRVPGGKELTAWPADWGPHSSTGRILDGSPYLLETLGIATDDTVEVIFPAPED